MSAAAQYPGASLGLPERGVGSLAPWWTRVVAVCIDWALALGSAFLIFGRGVYEGSGWVMWTPLILFGLGKALVTSLTGSSLGQLMLGIGVTKVDGKPVGVGASFLRTAMICVVLPALIVGPDRRGLDDVLVGTVVVRRRG